MKAARRLVTFLALGVMPCLFLASIIVHGATHGPAATSFFDFHAFWGAGHDVLHGRSPYPPPSTRVLAREGSFVYPAPAAVAMVPFALLPYQLAAILFALILVASIPVGLRLVGVRDWRCYGIALVSAPFVTGINVDAISPILLLGLALVWRYRDRMVPAAAALAALVVLKLFLWPLLLWFAFTRRLTTALVAGALVAATSILSWAVIGFEGLHAYPHVLRILTRLLEGKGYSIVALGLSLGASRTSPKPSPWSWAARRSRLSPSAGADRAPTRGRSPPPRVRPSPSPRSRGSTTSSSCTSRSRSSARDSRGCGRRRSCSGRSAVRASSLRSGTSR